LFQRLDVFNAELTQSKSGNIVHLLHLLTFALSIELLSLNWIRKVILEFFFVNRVRLVPLNLLVFFGLSN